MKLFSTAVLATALLQLASPQGRTEEARLDGLDQEELELYQVQDKGKTGLPNTVAIKVNTKTGEEKIIYPKKDLAPGDLINEADGESLERFDGTNMTTDTSTTVRLDMQRFDSDEWRHNRNRRHSFRHRFNRFHPYAPYFGYSYGPIYSYPRYYGRPYVFGAYPYRPYYRYWYGDSLVNFYVRL